MRPGACFSLVDMVAPYWLTNDYDGEEWLLLP